MTNNNNSALLRALQMYDFYLVDLNLYLDTHPNCEIALKKFKEITEKRNQAYNTYINKYGPLKATDNINDNYFSWVNNPWPWEGENY